MNIFQKIALAFTVIGGINWGLVGIFNFNLVDYLFQTGSVLSRIIYTVVGLCALFNIFLFFFHFERNWDE